MSRKKKTKEQTKQPVYSTIKQKAVKEANSLRGTQGGNSGVMLNVYDRQNRGTIRGTAYDIVAQRRKKAEERQQRLEKLQSWEAEKRNAAKTVMNTPVTIRNTAGTASNIRTVTGDNMLRQAAKTGAQRTESAAYRPVTPQPTQEDLTTRYLKQKQQEDAALERWNNFITRETGTAQPTATAAPAATPTPQIRTGYDPGRALKNIQGIATTIPAAMETPAPAANARNAQDMRQQAAKEANLPEAAATQIPTATPTPAPTASARTAQNMRTGQTGRENTLPQATATPAPDSTTYLDSEFARKQAELETQAAGTRAANLPKASLTPKQQQDKAEQDAYIAAGKGPRVTQEKLLGSYLDYVGEKQRTDIDAYNKERGVSGSKLTWSGIDGMPTVADTKKFIETREKFNAYDQTGKSNLWSERYVDQVLNSYPAMIEEQNREAEAKLRAFEEAQPAAKAGDLFDFIESFEENYQNGIINGIAGTAQKGEAQATLAELTGTSGERREDTTAKADDFFRFDFYLIDDEEDDQRLRELVYNGVMPETYAETTERMNAREIAQLNVILDDMIEKARTADQYTMEDARLASSTALNTAKAYEGILKQAQAAKKRLNSVRNLEGWADDSANTGDYDPSLRPDPVYETDESGTTIPYPKGTAIQQSYFWANEGMEALGDMANVPELVKPEFFMTEKQLEKFNKLYKNTGANSAELYLNALMPELEEKRDTHIELYYQQLADTPVAGTLARIFSPALNAAGGMSGLVGSVLALMGNKDAGKKSSGWYAVTNMVQTLREHQNDRIGQWFTNQFGDDAGAVAKFMANVTDSIADNLFAMGTASALTGNISSDRAMAMVQLIMSGEATGNTMLQKLSQGASPTEAALYALGDGVIEWLTERFSLEVILRPDVRGMIGNGKQLAGYLFKSIAAEGSEEGAADLANMALDGIISSFAGHETELKSRYNAELRALMANNPDMDPAEAQRLATQTVLKEKLGEIGLSILAGGISGGFMAGARGVGASFQMRSEGKYLKNSGRLNEMIQLGLDSGKNTKGHQLAEQLQQKLERGETITNREAGLLKANLEMDAGENIQRKTDMGLPNIDQEVGTLRGIDQLMSGQRGADEATGMKLATKEDIRAAEESGKKIEGSLGVIVNSEEGQKFGKIISIRQVMETKEGETEAKPALKFHVDIDGKDVEVNPASVLSTHYAGAVLLHSMEENPGIWTPEYTNILLQEMGKEGMDSGRVLAPAAESIRMAALTGAQMPQTGIAQSIAERLFNSSIEEEKARRAKEAGTANAKAQGTGRVMFKGLEYGTEAYKAAARTQSRQTRNLMGAAAEIARRAGVDLWLMDNEDLEKERQAGRLKFSRELSKLYGYETSKTEKDGKNGIVINIEGQNADGEKHHLMVTFGHEFMHWLQRNSTKAYDQLQKETMDMQRKALKGGQAGLNERLKQIMDSQHVDLHDAISELTADSYDQIFSSEKVIRNIQEQNPTLYTQMKNFVKDLVARLHNAIGDMGGSISRDAQRIWYRNADRMAELFNMTYDEATGKVVEAPAVTEAEPERTTADYVQAEYVGTGEARTVQARITNPLTMRQGQFIWMPNQTAQALLDSEEMDFTPEQREALQQVVEHAYDYAKSWDRIADVLQEQGYDGIRMADGQYVALKNTATAEEVETRLSQAEMDAEYEQAVKDKDTAKQEEMVISAARKAGYTLRAYHGTTGQFTEFDMDKSQYGASGYGFYFGNEKVAKSYEDTMRGGHVMNVLVKTDNLIEEDDYESRRIDESKIRNLLNRLNVPVERYEGYYGNIQDSIDKYSDYEIIRNLEFLFHYSTNISPKETMDAMREELGVDGIKNNHEIVLWDNKLIKSADPITYDDNGKVIPLSERFNPKKPDIRYSQAATEENADALEKDIEESKGPETHYGDHMRFSVAVTDPDTIEFLEKQKKIKTYKTMQLIDGKLYPPMAAVVDGKMEDPSVLGQWEMATEHPELIRKGSKFVLNKGKGQGTVEAAYNPYMHSSNLMINDQFTGAYSRPNLVTVECEVPASEADGAYHAEYAKDSTGWHSWHTGPVAGELRKAKGTERQVFLSRYIKPVRIVPNSEVAQHYAELIKGTDIQVPDNVVPPDLLTELKKAGVPIKESGRVKYSQAEMDAEYEQAVKDKDTAKQQEMVKAAAQKAGYTKKVYHGTPYGGFTQFRDWSYFTESKEYADRYNHPSQSSTRGYYSDTQNPMTYALYMNPGRVFDTRDPETAKVYEQFRQEYGLGQLTENGLPDWTDGRDIIEFIEENNLPYDTIILNEGADGGYGAPVVSRGVSYVTRSNMVKSAEPVTYDDNGNVIPLSERFNPEKTDIRYSQAETTDPKQEELYNALEEANAKVKTLRERVRAMKPEVDAWTERITEAFDNGTFDQIQEEYKEWEKGYVQLREELTEAERAYRQANQDFEDYIEQRDVAKEKAEIEKSGLTEAEYRRKQAVKTFGTTSDFNEAGYLMPDGKMLDFSGKKHGGQRGTRSEDHRAIGQIYASSQKQGGEAMLSFMRDGNIRVMATTPGIDIISSIEPTAEQYSQIRKMAQRFAGEEYFNIDFTDENGQVVDTLEYDGRVNPERIINDIKTFYRTGAAPQQSVVSQFHYSQAGESDIDVETWMETRSPGSFRTEDERIMWETWKRLRNDVRMVNFRIEEYKKQIRALEAKGENLTAEERDQLRGLRNKLEVKQVQLDRLEKELRKTTSTEGFATMMRNANLVIGDFMAGKTQEQVTAAVDTMTNEVERAEKEIAKQEKELQKLGQESAVKTVRAALRSRGMNTAVNALRSQYGTTMSQDELEGRLAEIILKSLKGEDVTADIEALANDVVTRQAGYGSVEAEEALSALRGKTIVIGPGQQAEMKANHITLKDLQKRIKGSGIKLVYGESSTLDTNAEELEAEVPAMKGMLDNEKASLENLVGYVENLLSLKNSNAEESGYDVKEVESFIGAMAQIMLNENAGGMSKADLIAKIKAEAGRIGTALNAVRRIRESLGTVRESGAKAQTWTGVLGQDLDQVLDYYDQVARMAARQERTQVRKTLVEQLKAENTKKLMQQQEKYEQMMKNDRTARQLANDNMTLRSKINTAVKRISRLMTQETDQKNIPEEAKPLARLLVKMFVEHDSNYRRVTFSDNKQLQRAAESLRGWQNLYGDFDFDHDLDWLIIGEGSEADTEVKEAVEQALQDIEMGLLEYRNAEGRGTVSLQDRKNALTKIQDAVAKIYNVIQARRYAEINGKRALVTDLAMSARDDMQHSRFRGEWTGWLGRRIGTARRALAYGNLTPVYFFKNLRNGTLSSLFRGYESAENKNGLAIARAQATMQKIAQETGYGTWDQERRYEIQLEKGGTVRLTLGEMMSLYATWQRELMNQSEINGPEKSFHLTLGGFVTEPERIGGIAGRQIQQQRPHRVTEDDIAKIRSLMTPQQLEYVQRVVEYITKEIGELGNEASMKMFGIKKFNEKWYFPFEVWRGVMNKKSTAGAQNMDKNAAAHPSQAHRRTANAKNALVIRDFTQTVARHIVSQINYNTFAPAIEWMQRVMNTRLSEGADVESMTERNLWAMFQEVYGKDAHAYFTQFQKDMNGGATQQSKDFYDRLISTFRKSAVAGSLSVAAQQPLSYIRAAMEINPRWLVEALNPRYYRGSNAEMEKWSGVAVLKRMGKFDMGFGETAAQYIAPEARQSMGRRVYETASDWTTALPELMDRVTWTRMWTAAKLEQAHLHPEMDPNSDEFMELVAERFNDIIRRTQVYDSTLVRSQNMRAKDSKFLKTLTSFMAEPTLTANVLVDSLINVRQQGGMRRLATAASTFILSAIAQAAVKGTMGAGRNPDKKKTWEENWWYRFMYNFISEANPVSLIPGYSDLMTLLKKGELNDDAMGMIGKLLTAAKKTTSLLNSDDPWRDVEDSVGVIAQLFSNIPVKNLMRDARAMYNFFTQPYAQRETSQGVLRYQLQDQLFAADNLMGAINTWLGNDGYKSTVDAYALRIYQAQKSGDEEAARLMSEYVTLAKSGAEDPEKALQSKLKSIAKKDKDASAEETMQYLQENGGSEQSVSTYIMDELKDGKIDAEEARKLLKQNEPDKSEDDIWWKVDRAEYAKENGTDIGGSDKYYRLYDAMESNRAEQINAAVKGMTEHGMTQKQIKDQLSKKYKQKYLDADQKGKVKIRNALEIAYKALGYTKQEAGKIIDGWKEKK